MNLRTFAIFGGLLGLLCANNSFAQTQLSGEIEGAKYVITLPEKPIGKTLLLAHGYRPANLGLKADAGASHNLYEELVEEGWVVASSSYRRNGWIMEDAAQDMINLHELVSAAMHGDPGDVYLMGNSMGGGVSTLLAEIAPDRFNGALAMGAYLFEPIESETHRSTIIGSHFSLKPQIPVLYLTNTSELEGPMAYIEKTSGAPVQPVLWKVHRDGHVNLNVNELEAGLNAVIAWAETGEIEKNKDATIVPDPDSTATISETEATGYARTLVEVYGNAISSFVRSDIEALGIQLGDTFELSANGKTVPVLMGSNYNDVPVGDWVSFWDANGYLLFCRNYRNAVETLGLGPKNALTITAK